MTGYVIQGFNPLMSFPNRAKMTDAFSKMKFIVVMDPLKTETARFWENHGEYNDVDPTKIQTEVFELPTTLFVEEEGSLANSSRWLQWHWQAQEAPGECRSDIEIMSEIFLRMKEAYHKDGGAFPDPIVNLRWDYAIAESPTPVELAKELNGYTLAPTPDLNGTIIPPRSRTTAPQPAPAGSTRVATPRRAAPWPAGTIPIPAIAASLRTGPSRGRPIAGCSTTARPATRRASPGPRRRSSSSGTGSSGSASTCRTMA